MKFLILFLMAWVSFWLTQVPPTDDLALDLSVAAGFGLVAALLTWLYARRFDNYSKLITSSGWMLIVIGVLGSGGAYGHARSAGLEPGDANLEAILGWPGIVGLIGIALIIFGKRRKAPDDER